MQGLGRQDTKEKKKRTSFYSANDSDRGAYENEDPLPESKAEEIYQQYKIAKKRAILRRK